MAHNNAHVIIPGCLGNDNHAGRYNIPSTSSFHNTPPGTNLISEDNIVPSNSRFTLKQWLANNRNHPKWEPFVPVNQEPNLNYDRVAEKYRLIIRHIIRKISVWEENGIMVGDLDSETDIEVIDDRAVIISDPSAAGSGYHEKILGLVEEVLGDGNNNEILKTNFEFIHFRKTVKEFVETRSIRVKQLWYHPLLQSMEESYSFLVDNVDMLDKSFPKKRPPGHDIDEDGGSNPEKKDWPTMFRVAYPANKYKYELKKMIGERPGFVDVLEGRARHIAKVGGKNVDWGRDLLSVLLYARHACSHLNDYLKGGKSLNAEQIARELRKLFPFLHTKFYAFLIIYSAPLERYRSIKACQKR